MDALKKDRLLHKLDEALDRIKTVSYEIDNARLGAKSDTIEVKILNLMDDIREK